MQAEALAKVQEQHTRVKRSDLLDKLKTNRDQHGKDFKIALDGWRIMYAKKLEKYSAEFVKAADKLRSDDDAADPQLVYLTMPSRPEDHTEDYTRIIARMEMSQDDEIFITHKDFDRYVLDQWQWKHKHLEDVANYSTAVR